MAAIGNSVPTLLDLAKSMGPDGSFDTDRVNLLTQSNEVLLDMVWKPGNLLTGHRTTIVTGLPAVYFRRINEGVPLSKSTGAQVDEGSAMLEGFFQVDRELALLSGNVNRYRYEESRQFMESMNQTLAAYLFYGNAGLDPKQFNGLAVRYSTIGAGNSQIVDAGGVGTDNTSIWLIGWGDLVHGIYPKNTTGGLQHEDVTVNKASYPGVEGAYVGDVLFDPNGNQYMGYKDHFIWRCGLAVRDYRAIVRIANIDVSNLVTNSTPADLIVRMIQAYYRVPTQLRKNNGANGGLSRAAWYVNPTVKAILHTQAMSKASAQITLREIDGVEVVSFLGLPVREVEQILNTEARVV
ncbi:MAG: major capsid protein [Beijerinckiaceae bacterium]